MNCQFIFGNFAMILAAKLHYADAILVAIDIQITSTAVENLNL